VQTIRVLIIEDNAGDADLVREMLDGDGGARYEIEHAEDLQAGTLCYADRGADVALLDLGLPDSVGLETVSEARRRCPDLALVVLTGQDDPDLALAALRAGADDYLVKGGFAGELLRRTLRHAIERKHGEVALRQEADLVETLHRVGAILASELRLENLVQAVTDAATRLADAEFGAFFYSVTGSGLEKYMLYSLSGAPREAFARFPMPRDTPLFGPTFRGEATVRIADVHADPRYGRVPPHHGMPEGHLPVRSYLAVPVVSRSGEVLGGLFFGHSRPGVFTGRHERLVEGVAGWAAISLDNARLLEEAQRASRIRDDVLGVVSHDLRNLLSTVTMATHMLMTAELPAERRARHLAAIDSAGRAMRRLMDDLLDATGLERGTLSLDRGSQPVEALLAEAHRTFDLQAREKGIELSWTADEGLPPIWGDRERLLQVLGNLAGNAFKFTPPGGRVTLSALLGDGVVFTVSDTGEGIDAADLPRLFDRFYRGRNQAAQGVGLGLAICKGIVDAHGGRIWVDSRKGEGASFRFTVPLAVAMQGAGGGS
jgi:signal transduction histidine kinase/DNA-binding response OmpR family regulator